MHARYYSPNLGRFLSVDPVGGRIGSSQSWNRYSYVLNNPIMLIDPSGKSTDVSFDEDTSTLKVVWNVEFSGEGASQEVVDQIVKDVSNAYTGQVDTLDGQRIKVLTQVNAKVSADGGEFEGQNFDQIQISDSAPANKINEGDWTPTLGLESILGKMTNGPNPMKMTNSLAGGASTGVFRTSDVGPGSGLPGTSSHEFGHILGSQFHVSGGSNTDPMSTLGDKTHPWFQRLQPYQASWLLKVAGQ